MLQSLVVHFLVTSSLLLPTFAAYYGFNEPITEQQHRQQLALDEATLERLQDVLYQNEPSEDSAYPDNWQPEAPAVIEALDWPRDKAVLSTVGQVAGLATCHEGKLHLFQRGPIVWDEKAFAKNNSYLKRDNGPITNDTVVVLDPETGSLLHSWGANRFYMPHGISIDPQGNVWLTDVALHQVFRFKRDNLKEADLVLGEAFVPGSDEKHFCKPTDVAVSSSGVVYISDGYCNSRIVIADPNGKLVGQIAFKDGLLVPHSLSLLEKEDLICVADREQRRILCYTAGLQNSRPGRLVFNVGHERLGRVFAIDHLGDLVMAVNGPDNEASKAEGLTLDLATERLVEVWQPQSGFVEPHDLAVSKNGQSMFVSDIGHNALKKVYKFKLGA